MRFSLYLDSALVVRAVLFSSNSSFQNSRVRFHRRFFFFRSRSNLALCEPYTLIRLAAEFARSRFVQWRHGLCGSSTCSYTGGRFRVSSVLLAHLVKIAHSGLTGYKYVAGVSLKSYLETAANLAFSPKDEVELKLMLDSRICTEALGNLGRPPHCSIPANNRDEQF